MHEFPTLLQADRELSEKVLACLYWKQALFSASHGLRIRIMKSASADSQAIYIGLINEGQAQEYLEHLSHGLGAIVQHDTIKFCGRFENGKREGIAR